MKVSSTKLPLPKLAQTASAGAATALTAKGVAQVADSVLLSATSAFTPSQTPLTHPSLGILGGLGQNSALIAASAGLTSGLAVAAGASFGTDEVQLADKPLWKRLLFSGPVNSFNQGIAFREATRSAQKLKDPKKRFQAGAEAGWTLGSKLGKTVGTLQGGLTGAHLGWQYSGDALQFVQTLTENTPLPKPLQTLMPLAVGASCVVLGQMAGSVAGGAIGQITGGTIGGLAVGGYTTLNR